MGNSASNDDNTSDLNSKSTSDQVAENYGSFAEGKFAVVTGGNGGLGLETARVLASKGSNVVIACRSLKNGEEAVAKLLAENPEAKVSAMQLDLGSFSSIRQFASDYKASGKPLHLLINNAGVMACPRTLTSEGLEMQFGTNYVGHFLLTTLLLDVIKASGTAAVPARIINLSSIAQFYFSPAIGMRLDDLNGEQTYDAWERYGSSKLATILFTKQLHTLLSQENAPVVTVSVHPGVISETNLTRHMDLASTLNILSKIAPRGLGTMYSFMVADSKTIKQGAATTLYAALAPEIVKHSGAHFADCHEDTIHVHPTANDAKLAQDLWTASESIVNK